MSFTGTYDDILIRFKDHLCHHSQSTLVMCIGESSNPTRQGSSILRCIRHWRWDDDLLLANMNIFRTSFFTSRCQKNVILTSDSHATSVQCPFYVHDKEGLPITIILIISLIVCAGNSLEYIFFFCFQVPSPRSWPTFWAPARLFTLLYMSTDFMHNLYN